MITVMMQGKNEGLGVFGKLLSGRFAVRNP